jgi:uncharacterized membrane protein YjfL (UPF0719 family)
MIANDAWFVLIVAVTLVALAYLARLAFRLLWSTSPPDGTRSGRNPAQSIEFGGYYAGVLVIAGAVLAGVATVSADASGGRYLAVREGTAARVLLLGTLGVVLLALLGRLGLRLIIRARIHGAVAGENLAAGVVAGGAHLATALVIASVMSGDTSGGDAVTLLVFFATGMLTLWLFTSLFRFITRYDDAHEIADGNVAAALSYAGMMVAVALIVGHALQGDFVDYPTSFILYGKALAAVLFLYPVRQVVVQGILLDGGWHFRGGHLDDEIEHARNVGVSVVEAASYLATATLAIRVLG